MHDRSYSEKLKLHLPHIRLLVQYHVQDRDQRIHAHNCNINAEASLNIRLVVIIQRVPICW